MAPSSPKALYRAIPQDIDMADQENDAEPRGDENFLVLPPQDSSTVLVDSRIRLVHFILGCAVLLPWNALITATPFFLSRLSSSPYRSVFSSYLSSSFMLTNFIFLGHATAISKTMIPSRQIRRTLMCTTSLTILLALSRFVKAAPGVFLAFVLANAVIQAAASSYMLASVTAVASLFGPSAVQALMAGYAAVAVAVCCVQVMGTMTAVWGQPHTYVSDGSPEERTAFIFFSLSSVFLIVSIGAHSWLIKTSNYRVVASSLEQTRSSVANATPEERHDLLSKGRTNRSAEIGNALRVAKANIIYEIAVAYVFVVTLAVFPPITTSVQPTDPNIHPLLFTAVHFLVYNVGDFLGRYVCSFPIFLVWSSKRLLTMSLARTLFIPLFLMCNIQQPSAVTTPPIISSDTLFMFIVFLFGWSNGYTSSLCMMFAPSLEHNPKLKGRVEHVDVAATVANFCLVGGLALGSVCSFAVKAILCKCNPFL